MLDPPHFAPGDFVVTNGTRPGACFPILECPGVDDKNRHRWYLIEIGSASDLLAGVPYSCNPYRYGSNRHEDRNYDHEMSAVDQLAALARNG